MPKDKLELIKQHIDSLPILPETVTRLMRVINDPEGSAQGVMETILSNQSLCLSSGSRTGLNPNNNGKFLFWFRKLLSILTTANSRCPNEWHTYNYMNLLHKKHCKSNYLA